MLPNGKSIEFTYQTSVKGYNSIKEGKGKPPLNPNVNLYEEYLKLWKIWAKTHDKLLSELMLNISKFNYVLSDRFATTEVNQAHALADILNERQSSLELK